MLRELHPHTTTLLSLLGKWRSAGGREHLLVPNLSILWARPRGKLPGQGPPGTTYSQRRTPRHSSSPLALTLFLEQPERRLQGWGSPCSQSYPEASLLLHCHPTEHRCPDNKDASDSHISNISTGSSSDQMVAPGNGDRKQVTLTSVQGLALPAEHILSLQPQISEYLWLFRREEQNQSRFNLPYHTGSQSVC